MIGKRRSFLEEQIVYFEKAGRRNTEDTLRLVAERARARGINKIVLASTRGNTARLAAEQFAGSEVKLVVIPHQYGFLETFGYTQRFSPELVSELEQQGHRVHFGTMPFHTDDFYGTRVPQVMATLLRTFCQGMKVCVEIILMAVDGGHVPIGEEIVAVTGTGRGADTAVVAIAAPSTSLSDLHITEIICKPLQTKSWPAGATTRPWDSSTDPGKPMT
jgi:hypothetical protein